MQKPALSTKVPGQKTALRTGLTAPEIQALRRADLKGWLTIAPVIGDAALNRWQQKCQRGREPFAILRTETTRASLWFVLPYRQTWSAMEQERIRDCLRGATGILVTANSVRAFLPLGTEDDTLERLLAFTRTRKRRIVNSCDITYSA